MTLRNSCWLALALVLSVLARPCMAGEAKKPLGVIELFTSQGCNSCPPADELFAEFASRDDVVALAYHVDYWDYLGWQDTLGSKQNTERQYDYMRAFRSRSVYTPQAVLNGRSHVNGAKRDAVTGALESMDKAGEGMLVDVAVSRDENGDVMIDAGDASGEPNGAPVARNAHVVIVYFDPPQTIRIAKGENDGREITYWNAVSSVQTAGMWHGKAQRYELPASEVSRKGGCAVLLQAVGRDGLPGPIFGAAFIHKPSP